MEEGLYVKSNPSWRRITNSGYIISRGSNKLLGFMLKDGLKFHKRKGQNFNKFTSKTTLRKVASDGVVKSGIVGYMDANNYHPCRMTALYRDNFKDVNQDLLPVVEEISRLYQLCFPDNWNKQRLFVESLNQNMVIGKSVFTTITVNQDFRTRTHRDTGDYNSGFGCLAVFGKGFRGGELLLPDYKIEVQMNEGDLLFFDVHELHCNNPIYGKGRVSLVCYAREGIAEKCKDVSVDELRYFKPRVNIYRGFLENFLGYD